MVDPYRLTLLVGTPEHSAFDSQLMLAYQRCGEANFKQTIAIHQDKFNVAQDYTLLINDYQYIVDLSIQALAFGAPTRH